VCLVCVASLTYMSLSAPTHHRYHTAHTGIRRLRPEFVSRYYIPLSPDAGTAWCPARESLTAARVLRRAARALEQCTIPRLALALVQRYCDGLFRPGLRDQDHPYRGLPTSQQRLVSMPEPGSAASYMLWLRDLVSSLHRVGVNLRYLGLVRLHVTRLGMRLGPAPSAHDGMSATRRQREGRHAGVALKQAPQQPRPHGRLHSGVRNVGGGSASNDPKRAPLSPQQQQRAAQRGHGAPARSQPHTTTQTMSSQDPAPTPRRVGRPPSMSLSATSLGNLVGDSESNSPRGRESVTKSKPAADSMQQEFGSLSEVLAATSRARAHSVSLGRLAADRRQQRLTQQQQQSRQSQRQQPARHQHGRGGSSSDMAACGTLESKQADRVSRRCTRSSEPTDSPTRAATHPDGLFHDQEVGLHVVDEDLPSKAAQRAAVAHLRRMLLTEMVARVVKGVVKARMRAALRCQRTGGGGMAGPLSPASRPPSAGGTSAGSGRRRARSSAGPPGLAGVGGSSGADTPMERMVEALAHVMNEVFESPRSFVFWRKLPSMLSAKFVDGLTEVRGHALLLAVLFLSSS